MDMLQHMLLSTTPRMSTVRLHMDTQHHTKLNMRSEIVMVMLLDYTHTSTQRERSLRWLTLLESMDSKSTPMTYQLLQLLILLSQLLQYTQELHPSQFRIHLRLLLLKLLTLSS